MYLCVLFRIDLPCNSVLNTTKGLNQLNIYLFIRQTSRLCTSAAKEFNKGLPGIGAAGCQTCIEAGFLLMFPLIMP